MDTDKRDKQIYKLREEGATFSHIASLFNISRTRAAQVYSRIKHKKEHFDTWPPLKKVLSVRSQKALISYFKTEDILNNPQKIANLGRVKFPRIRNLGRKSIKEIAFALHDLGYIENIDVWLNQSWPKKICPNCDSSLYK